MYYIIVYDVGSLILIKDNEQLQNISEYVESK